MLIQPKGSILNWSGCSDCPPFSCSSVRCFINWFFFSQPIVVHVCLCLLLRSATYVQHVCHVMPLLRPGPTFFVASASLYRLPRRWLADTYSSMFRSFHTYTYTLLLVAPLELHGHRFEHTAVHVSWVENLDFQIPIRPTKHVEIRSILLVRSLLRSDRCLVPLVSWVHSD